MSESQPCPLLHIASAPPVSPAITLGYQGQGAVRLNELMSIKHTEMISGTQLVKNATIEMNIFTKLFAEPHCTLSTGTVKVGRNKGLGTVIHLR